MFTKAYDSSPVMTQNLAQAKKLVQQAGAAGQTITIGMSSQLANIAAVAGAYQSAAQAIGLKAKLKSVSAQNYINFFTDPKARAGVDGFLTINYGDYADPAALLSTIVLPGGSQNYDNYNDPKTTSLLEQARGTADPGPAGGAGRAGGAAGGEEPAVDPERAADQRADHEQEPDRRGRLVRLHVRAVGGQPRRDRLSGGRRCSDGSWPAGWRCSSPACWWRAS